MSLPLSGVRIVDLTVVWAGPFGTVLLADLGADVIKVENVHVWQPMTRGSIARPTAAMVAAGGAIYAGFPDGAPGPRPWNQTPTFINIYRNKRSVTIDIRSEEGRHAFEQLIATADVVYENNVSETMEKLGITYDYLRAIKPDIIFLRAPAYGSSGPYRNYRALGVHLEGVSGHSLLRRYPDDDASSNTGIFAGDYFAGTHGAFAVMAALHYRKRTGKGQLIEIPQVEVAAGMLAQFIMDYALNRHEDEPFGNRDYHGAAPQGVYRCAGADRWLALTVPDDTAWAATAAELGHPEWAGDPRFATAEARRTCHDELDQLIGEAVKQRDVWQLTHALQARGVPAGPVMDARDAHDNPHLHERGMFPRMYQADCGERAWVGTFLRTFDGPLPMRRPPVALGEDNAHVWKDLLGVAEADYDRMVAAGDIGESFDETIP